MEERQIYQLTSGAGYVVVVNGNFVSLRYSGSSVHTAVMAFPEDANMQSQGFDDAAEAVAWATSAAESHVGKPWRYSRVEHWESRQCYSITIERGDSGLFRTDVFPMWADSDRYPHMRDLTTFSTLDEAIEHARNWADAQITYDAEWRQRLRQLREALGGGEPWTGYMPE